MTAMSKSKRADGWWYPWIFVAGFGVVILVNGFMAYTAVHSWTGLENQHAFQHAQAYNAELAQRKTQALMGWQGHAEFVAQPTQESAEAGVLHLRITDRQGQGVSGLVVGALAMRPTSEGHDRNLTFVEQEPGVYVTPADLPLPGQWELRITATRADDVFKMRQRIQVP